jgi:hypothetical protein
MPSSPTSSTPKANGGRARGCARAKRGRVQSLRELFPLIRKMRVKYSAHSRASGQAAKRWVPAFAGTSGWSLQDLPLKTRRMTPTLNETTRSRAAQLCRNGKRTQLRLSDSEFAVWRRGCRCNVHNLIADGDADARICARRRQRHDTRRRMIDCREHRHQGGRSA